MFLGGFISDVANGGGAAMLSPTSLTDMLFDSGKVRATDTLDGRSATSELGRVFTASGTVGVNQPLARTNSDHLATQAFVFSTGMDRLTAPDSVIGDVTGTANWLFACGLRFPADDIGLSFGSIAGKFDAPRGWQLLINSDGTLRAQVEPTGGSVLLTTVEEYNDAGLLIIALHIVRTPGQERVVLATERERIEGTWPGGSASTATAFILGSVQAFTNDLQVGWCAFFVDTPADLKEQALVRAWHQGKDPQSETGHGWTNVIQTARVG